jgi:hypothetical protein
MRRVPGVAVATGICLLGLTLVSISPAGAATGITVTPNTNLPADASVVVEGTGWPASVDMGVCQAINDGTPNSDDCASLGFAIHTSSTGTFSTNLAVHRNITPPSVGHTVDCAVEDCFVAAALVSDVAGTVVFAPITFSSGLADGRIKRRSDGTISFDNVYSGEARSHTIAPGTDWTYALQVQNDGPATGDVTVTATKFATLKLAAQVQFFVGFYDVTAAVLSHDGFTFTDLAPGEVGTFALRFRVPADGPVGSEADVNLTFIAGGAGATDRLALRVHVRAAS